MAGPRKSSTAVCHGFCGHWNTAFNFDLHFGGAAAKTSSQLIHDVGSLSHEKTIPLCARAFSLFRRRVRRKPRYGCLADSIR
jgi:hypothetical protein